MIVPGVGMAIRFTNIVSITGSQILVNSAEIKDSMGGRLETPTTAISSGYDLNILQKDDKIDETLDHSKMITLYNDYVHPSLIY